MRNKKIGAFSLGVICWLLVPVASFSDKLEREGGSIVAVTQSSSNNWGLAGVVWFGIAALYDVAERRESDIEAV